MYKIRVFVGFFFSHTADVSKHIKISTVWGRYSLYFRKRRHSDRVLTVNKGHLFGDWGWDPGLEGKQLFPESRGMVTQLPSRHSLPFFGPKEPLSPSPRGKDSQPVSHS